MDPCSRYTHLSQQIKSIQLFFHAQTLTGGTTSDTLAAQLLCKTERDWLDRHTVEKELVLFVSQHSSQTGKGQLKRTHEFRVLSNNVSTRFRASNIHTVPIQEQKGKIKKMGEE